MPMAFTSAVRLLMLPFSSQDSVSLLAPDPQRESGAPSVGGWVRACVHVRRGGEAMQAQIRAV